MISSQLFLWLCKNSPKHAQNAHIFLTGGNATMKIVLATLNSRATQDPFIYFHATKKYVWVFYLEAFLGKNAKGRGKI